MLNYTDSVRLLMQDIVSRVPALSFIDVGQILVFARLGRTAAHGAYATCHSLTMPDSQPAYYFWRDRRTGRLTRRSEWFVMRSPDVQVGDAKITYLISVVLPRFADQTLRGSRKEEAYPGYESWVAKLDTIVHELYHIDPEAGGIRTSLRNDGRPAAVTHTSQFFRDVAAMAQAYLATKPDPSVYDFLRHDFADLTRMHGTIVGTTFRSYPSFPQRYRQRVVDQPRTPRAAHVVQVHDARHRAAFTERDLQVRAFAPQSSRLVTPDSLVGVLGRRARRDASLGLAANRSPR